MADQPTNPAPPKGLLSFMYHCYYNIDGVRDQFMSKAVSVMTQEFGLSTETADAIISLGQNNDSDDELADEFCDLLKKELTADGNFRRNIW